MNSMIKTCVATVAFAATLGFGTQQAAATTIPSLITVADGDPGFVVEFKDTDRDGNVYENVGSTFTWALDNVTENVAEETFTYNFILNIFNRSLGDTDENRITAFAFGTSPTLTIDDITVASGDTTYKVTDSFQAGFQNLFGIDLCVFASNKNCQSASSEFVGSGESIDLQLGLTVASSTLDFTGFAVRMASLAEGDSAVFEHSSVTPIPLPAAGWLLLGGLGGLAMLRRRRKDV